MPRLNSWADYFSRAFSGIASNFRAVPEGLDWERLGILEDKINSLWISGEATWPEFQKAIGEYRLFWFGYKNAADS